LDPRLLAELRLQFDTLDLDGFYRNLGALSLHDATDVLETVNVPTLVVAGDHDRLTPPTLAQQMTRRIPGAEILVVRGGTHYACIEFPELVNLRIERFFQDNRF
jgi:pimeloyl-ACP methyl ester carboxylesterase